MENTRDSGRYFGESVEQAVGWDQLCDSRQVTLQVPLASVPSVKDRNNVISFLSGVLRNEYSQVCEH